MCGRLLRGNAVQNALCPRRLFQTDLETQVARILEQNHALTEAAVVQREKEELVKRAMSAEEIKERQGELRRVSQSDNVCV